MKRNILILLFALPAYQGLYSQTVWHVFAEAQGQNNGQTWADAYTDLQSALGAAEYGDQIWVARGIYHPAGTNQTDRAIAFTVPKGVSLYGGFAGYETELDQRDWETHITTLSGEIGDPASHEDNSIHVLVGAGLDEATVIDGFVIENGHSLEVEHGQYWLIGSGMVLTGDTAMTHGSPQISHCVFQKNYSYGGGAMYVWADSLPCQPVIRDCSFIQNRSKFDGAGLVISGKFGKEDTLTIRSCLFQYNRCVEGLGGGMLIKEPDTSNYRLVNCIFDRDTALTGGGLQIFGDRSGYSIATVWMDSCSFLHCIGTEGGGFSYWESGIDFTSYGNIFNCKITNSRFEGNIGRYGTSGPFMIKGILGAQIQIDITDCIFIENLAGSDGNSLVYLDYNSALYMNIDRCIFKQNRGVVNNSPNFVFKVSVKSDTCYSNIHIRNSLFYENDGVIATYKTSSATSETRIENCTFYHNGEFVFAKNSGVDDLQTSLRRNKMHIYNCVIEEPQARGYKMFYNGDPELFYMHDYIVDYSMIRLSPIDSLQGWAGANLAIREHNQINVEPYFVDTLSSDFHLQTCSPLLGKGDNQIVYNGGYETDLDDSPRIQFQQVDIGAYESPDSCTVGVNMPFDELPLTLSPNPSADGRVIIGNLPDHLTGTALLSVSDATGKIWTRQSIAVSSVIAIDLQSLPAGLYGVSLWHGGQKWAGKWVRL